VSKGAARGPLPAAPPCYATGVKSLSNGESNWILTWDDNHVVIRQDCQSWFIRHAIFPRVL